MLDKKYIGWIQAIVLVFVFWGLSNIILSFVTQVLDINKLIFTGSTFLSCSVCLLLYAGYGKLSKETFRSIDTWVFGVMVLTNYFIALNLFSLLTPAEVTLLQRMSVIFSLIISWFFFGRKPGSYQAIGLFLIIAGLFFVCSDIPREIALKVYTLMFFGGIAQSLRVFLAESHKTHKKATEDTSIKSRCRVIGYVMFVVSCMFWIVIISMAWLYSVYQQEMIVDVKWEDFYSYQSILFGLVMGVIIFAPTRYLEFSSAEKINAENFLAVGALSFFATWLWQLLLADLIGLKTSTFETYDMFAGVLITLGALIMALSKMFSNNKTDELNCLIKSNQNINDVEETREIVANTLEHFNADLKKTAEALNIPVKVLNEILADKEKVIAFNEETLKQVARNYRRNVATSDALTGLLNRNGFITALKAASFESDKLSLFFIDLNRFKPVNDTYGHEAGDYVLQVIAKRLEKKFPHKSLITRLGGDEYCVLLLDVDKAQAESKISLINQEIETQIEYLDVTISVSGSIGLANYPEDTKNAEELISLADKQMYVEKNGR